MEALVESSVAAVYTRAWVVELLLDLAGYTAAANLVDARAVEPSVGEGAFLVPMAARLLACCRAQGRPWLDCRDALRAYDVDAAALWQTRRKLGQLFEEVGVNNIEAHMLLSAWLVEADYLLLVGRTTCSATQPPQLFDAPPPEGVDFVLGNPPYVRVESIPEAQNAQYRQLFPTMRGRADLYVGFYEAALRQLRPGGVCAFICADRWMVNQYGETLRRYITAGFAVETLLELHQTAAFEEAVSAYPAISVLRRAPQASAVVASATNDVEYVATGQLVAHLAAARRRNPYLAWTLPTYRTGFPVASPGHVPHRPAWRCWLTWSSISSPWSRPRRARA